jgi:hypothetical protein
MYFDARKAKALKPGEHYAIEGCPGLRMEATLAKIPSMPDVPTNASSSGSASSKPVVIVAGEVCQNVSDRGIAHKVTGGMGAS